MCIRDRCKLAADFGWYEKLSLAGWKVLVTRPKGRSSRTADDLRRRGAEVLELPSVRTVALDEQTELWQAFDRMDTYQWITFTSPTGAEIFFEELKNAHKDKMCIRDRVDAKQGVLVQTRRHSRICALMGIHHFVFAVNKMDLVGYSEDCLLYTSRCV